MALITPELLTGLGASPVSADLFAEPLNAACALFDISTKARVAAFLGQIMVESAYLKHLEEDLHYRADRIRRVFPSHVKTDADAARLSGNPQALASLVYANRYGNGPAVSGDGWKYRGRGFLGLTFKDNYKEAGIGTNRPYVDQPELSQPSDAALSAAWFWSTRKCNILADAGKIDLVTKAINGNAMLQADQRKALTQKALTLLG